MAPQARINIIEPSGVRRSMPLSPHGLIIGRDPTCEIALNYERVSRQHTQIDFDGRQCFVTDLDSRNGTYLGKNRLPPSTPTPWPPDHPLRIADVYLNLELPRFQEARREEMDQAETMVGYVPSHIKQKDNRKTLWIVVGVIALLCACMGLAGMAFLFLGA